MLLKFQTLKHHAGRWYGQLFLIALVFIVVRLYTMRDIVSGPAPEFSAMRLDGQLVQLQQYRGQPLLLHFWATWCPVCKLENSAIQSISMDYPVLTVAMNSGEAAEVRAYDVEHGLSFPTVIDAEGQLARMYGVRGVPSSFFVDAEGNIRFVEVGLTSEWGMRLRLWWLN